MNKLSSLLVVVLLSMISAGISRADDVALSIEPEFGFSSDHATLCRVVARNHSGHMIDGRTIAFEAQAWQGSVLVQTARGRFGGILESGETAESRIGFNGVFRQFTVTPVAAKASRGGSKRSGKGAAAKPAKKSAPKASSKAKKRKP